MIPQYSHPQDHQVKEPLWNIKGKGQRQKCTKTMRMLSATLPVCRTGSKYSADSFNIQGNQES